MDRLPLVAKSSKKEKLSPKTADKNVAPDDFNGVIMNMAGSVNVVEVVLIWLWFLLLHSELFIDQVLINISASSVNSDKNFTLKGTFIASIIMVIGVVLIDMIFG